MARSLDTFLDDFGEAGQAEASEPSAAANPEPRAEPEQRVEPQRDEPREERAPREPAKPEAEKHDDDDKPLPDDAAGLRAAMLDERRKRRDFKGERDKLAGRLEQMERELTEARKAPSQPQQQAQQAEPPRQQVAAPNINEDPVGYLAHMSQQWEQQRFSDKLDASEGRLRDKVGDDADVDAKIAKFKQLAAANPTLGAQLRNHAHPYKFAYDYVSKAETLEEIGDPTAYREKLRAEAKAEALAEARAELEAERNGEPSGGQQRQRVVLPQSLGTARSAGPRSPMAEAPAFEDIFKRKKRA